MKITYFLLIATVGLMLTGCVNTRYAWQNYDQKLYNHYKNSADHEQFIADIKEIIADSEDTGNVPPGIYAEYGYALYEKDNFSEAVTYFKKEHDKWPESKVLMAKMIDNALKRSQRAANPPEASAAVPVRMQEVAK